MQLCPEHWTQLRTAIHDRGLDHLVSRNGKEVAERTANLFSGSDNPVDFDPLMAANMAIISYYISQIGIEHLSEPACPLCTAGSNSADGGLPENWINGAADDVLQTARERGLISEQ